MQEDVSPSTYAGLLVQGTASRGEDPPRAAAPPQNAACSRKHPLGRRCARTQEPILRLGMHLASLRPIQVQVPEELLVLSDDYASPRSRRSKSPKKRDPKHIRIARRRAREPVGLA
jgi:hypothetical protein